LESPAGDVLVEHDHSTDDLAISGVHFGLDDDNVDQGLAAAFQAGNRYLPRRC
jgi:hypothetical protein